MTSDPRSAPATILTCVAAVGFTAIFQAEIGAERLVMDPTALSSEPWRLFTSTLAHGGILHLLFNLYWMWNFGRVIEGRLGSFVTTVLYLALAAGSGAAEYAVGRGGIGLSGVVYGLFGLLWIAERREPTFGGVMNRGIVQLFIGWFFLCIVMTRMNIMPVANTAHGAGALLGGLAGWLLVAPESSRRARTALLAIALCLCFAAATALRPHLVSGEERCRSALAQALEQLDGGDFEGARDRVDQIRREVEGLSDAGSLTPLTAYIYFSLGNEAFERERYDEAITLYRQVLRLTPDDATTWYNIGCTRQRLHQTDLARQAFRRAVELDPGNPDFEDALDGL